MYKPKLPKTKIFLSGLVLLVLINACSIEKRHHETGYHIEWYKNQKTTISHQKIKKNSRRNSSLIEKSDLVNQDYTTETQISTPDFGRLSINHRKNKIESKTFEESQTNFKKLKVQTYETDSTKSINNEPTQIKTKEEKNKYAKLGFIFSLIGIVYWPLLAASLFFCIKALKDIKANGGRGKGLAIAGIIISTIFSLLVIIFILIAIYIFIFFLFFF
jgi:hypothetical protein